MADQVKLAFIGCGTIVQAHLNQGLLDFPDVQFVGFCDLNSETAEARRQQVGGQGQIYNDAATMLDEAKPDAVYIMLPPFAHGPVEQLVIDRRIPFFIEKPVAIDLDTAKRVQDGVTRHDLLTSVGYMHRYRQGVQQVREMLQRQKPVLLHGGWLGSGPGPQAAIWNWWYKRGRSGGQFVEQTTHTTDLTRFLFGEVEFVYATAVRDRREDMPEDFDAEHASMVQLRFANGAVGSLYSACCMKVSNGVSLTVFGTDLYAAFSGGAHDVEIKVPDGELTRIESEPNILSLEDRAFVDSVKAGRNAGILASYEDGLKATAIGAAG